MLASSLISDTIPPVKPNDHIGMALDWFGEFRVSQLPVVDNGRYLGLITEEEALEAADPDTPVGDVVRVGWQNAYVQSNNHIYDVIALMGGLKVEVLPVLDAANHYLGVITLRDIAEYLSQLFALNEPGGVLVLQIPSNSYMLSEIGRITESADTKVLSLYLAPSEDRTELYLNLKVNVEDLSRLVAAFERFNYKVAHIIHRGSRIEQTNENLDAFFRFLNM